MGAIMEIAKRNSREDWRERVREVKIAVCLGKNNASARIHHTGNFANDKEELKMRIATRCRFVGFRNT
jgi:translation initiation factor IF-3